MYWFLIGSEALVHFPVLLSCCFLLLYLAIASCLFCTLSLVYPVLLYFYIVIVPPFGITLMFHSRLVKLCIQVCMLPSVLASSLRAFIPGNCYFFCIRFAQPEVSVPNNPCSWCFWPWTFIRHTHFSDAPRFFPLTPRWSWLFIWVVLIWMYQ